MKPLLVLLFGFILLSGTASADTLTVSGTTGADIQTALNSAANGDTVIIPAGEYDISKQISTTGKDLTIEGSGDVTLNINTGGSPGLLLKGALITSQSITINAQKGSSKVVLSDASPVSQSDLIRIWNDNQWCPNDYPAQTTGELYLIESVSGNTITLNQPLLRDYNLKDQVTVEIFRPAEIHIKNIKFQNQDASGAREGLELRYCKDSSVTNSWFKDNGRASLKIYTCFNVDISDNEIYNSAKEGMGYGVAVADASAFINIKNNHIENCRHDIMSGTSDFKALNRDILITNNVLIGGSVPGSQVVDAHPNTINYEVTKNKIYPQDAFCAFNDGTQHSIFSENEVYGGHGAVAKRGRLDGCEFEITNNYVDTKGFLYAGTGEGAGESLIIKNNEQVGDSQWYGVGLSSESFKTIIINGNEFRNLKEYGIKIKCLIDGMDIEISDNTFSNVNGEKISIIENSHDRGDVSLTNNGDGAEYTKRVEKKTEITDTITVSGCDGSSDQDTINEALENAEPGDTVFLPSKTYLVDGPIDINCSGVTLQGEDGTVIKVAKTNKQWFKGLTGIINSVGFDDISIKDMIIDGSCDKLDNSLADSSSATSHDCERGIVIQGSSGDFVKNIVIKNVIVINTFSDGVHVRCAENVIVDSCEMSNCQHDSIYFVLVRNGIMKNNEIAGITADCTRFDNCEYSKAVYNTLFSYSGSKSNGAYLHGENAVQVGDQGHSYGGGDPGKSAIIHTNNIEIAYNKIINCGLEAVLLDAAGLGLGENIYIHDNDIIGDEEFETSGVPVEVLDGIEDVKNGKTPTQEQSEAVFDSIFDILDLKFTNSGRNEQTADDIDIEIEERTKGLIYGGMKIVGFSDVIYIDGIPYIPDENAILMKYKIIQSPDLIGWVGRIKRIEKIEEKRIEDGTAYAVLTVKSHWYTVKTDPVTGAKRKSKIKTSTAVFRDSCPAPEILPKEHITKAYVNVFSDTANPFAKVTTGHTDTTQRIEYTYEKNTTTRTFMIGERATDETGLQYTAYSRCDVWAGDIPHMGNDLILVGKFDQTQLHIKYYTPYETFEIEDIDIIYHENKEESRTMIILKFIIYLALAMYAGYKIMKTIIT